MCAGRGLRAVPPTLCLLLGGSGLLFSYVCLRALQRRVYIRRCRGFFVNVTAGRAVYKSAERPEASGWGVATLLREIIAKDVKTRGGEGKDLTIRTLYLPALIVAAVLMACAVVVLVVSEEADAAFSGKNSRTAYQGSDGVIYTINPGGGRKTKVTEDFNPSFSADGKKIAYSAWGGNDQEIYTVKDTGRRPFTYTYSASDALSENSQGFNPGGGVGPAYNASEKLQQTKTEDGARVTLNWVYAEENYVSIGYQVEDLKDDRRVAGHPAELQPILGFGYGKPTPREKKYFKKYGLGTDIVALTDERETKFKMADNSEEFSAGSKPVKGPLENL